MARPRLERRYSADHIRQQPEFKFITSGEQEPYSRIPISVRDFEDGQTNRQFNELKRRASVGQLVTCTDTRIQHSPRRAFTSGVDGEPAIRVLSKVDRRFSSVSAITWPRVSEGFCCHVLPGDNVDDQTEGACGCPTQRQPARGSMTSPTRRGFLVRESAKPCSSAKQAYDAKLEKSTAFLYGKDKSFSETSKYLSGAGPCARRLHLHYTETNTAQNDAIIFADLLRIANYRNCIVSESVYSLERRLYNRRANPSRTTTFFDRRPSDSSCQAERRRPRTVAQKKKERKEKINKKNEEIQLGYVPTARSLKTPGPEDIEEIRRNCRYLRIDPRLQRHLYQSGTEASSSSSTADVKRKPAKIVFKLPAGDHSAGIEDSDSSDGEQVTCVGSSEGAVTGAVCTGDRNRYGDHGDTDEAKAEADHCGDDEDNDVFTNE